MQQRRNLPNSQKKGNDVAMNSYTLAFMTNRLRNMLNKAMNKDWIGTLVMAALLKK
jgi:hypothetical protein